MNKVIVFTFLVFSALTGFVFSQTKDESVLPNIRLRLSTEETLWETGKKAAVKIVVENLSEKAVSLPNGIHFTVTDGTQSAAVTMREKVFWSPVSLTKIYEKINTCQNDLTKERVSTPGDKNIIQISPSAQNFILKKGEKKEFSFNLAGTCWNHVLSSSYPYRNLFTLTGFGKFKVYFEMEFDAGEKEFKGIKYPAVEHVKSNEIEIIINRLGFGEKK